MIICLGINFLVGKYYLPRFYFNKVEKFLEYHNILVYNQDKLAWSIGKGCCFLRLCLKYPEAFMEIMLDQSEYNSINQEGYQMLNDSEEDDFNDFLGNKILNLSQKNVESNEN